MLHPAGTLQVSQRSIPLDLKIDKVGSQAPSDANQFAFSVSGTVLTKTRDLQEPFAPSQFRNFDDATKLSQPAFVPQDSGIELAGSATLTSATAITRPVRYDLTVVDAESEPARSRFFPHARVMFTSFLARQQRRAIQALGQLPRSRRVPMPVRLRYRTRPSPLRCNRRTRSFIPRRQRSRARPRRTITSPTRWRPIRRSTAHCMSFPSSRSQHEHQSTPAPPIADPEDLLGTYAFLPWLRQGVANAITAPPATGNRASIHVELDSLPALRLPATHRSPSRIAQDISLYGPGDILGIDAECRHPH